MKITFLAAFLILLSTPAFSAVSEDEAQHIILGAASDEGYTEMYAIAKALRNRDNPNVPEVISYIDALPVETKALALKAWRDSGVGHDPTNGANAWYNQEDNGNFIRPPMVGKPGTKNEFTTKIGRHSFYRLEEDA